MTFSYEKCYSIVCSNCRIVLDIFIVGVVISLLAKYKIFCSEFAKDFSARRNRDNALNSI